MAAVVSVRRSEWRWAAAASATVLALTTVPYVVGFLQNGPAWHFSGFVFGVDDGNSYIGKMALGARGEWVFHLFYTTEPHRGALVFLFHMLLGKLAVLIAPPAGPVALHDRLVWWYHGARLVCGFLLLLVSYRFCAEFLPLRRQRRLAFVLVAVGGGLGWLLALTGAPGLPLDFYSPEAYTFLNLYGLPHLALARALLLGGFLLYLRGTRAGGLRPGAWAGLLWLALGFVQPLYLVVAYAAAGAHVLLLAAALRNPFSHSLREPSGKRVSGDAARAFWTAALAGGLSLPVVVYTLLAFRSDPILAQWQRQNLILSPGPLQYLAGWGLWLAPGALAVARWVRTRGRARPGFTFLIAWLAVVPFLLYLPYNLQRRFAEGAQLPLVCLAVWGLTTGLRPVLRRPARRLVTVGITAASLLTTPLLLAGGLAFAARPGPPVFLPGDELNAFRWLGENAAPGAAVLAQFDVGNALPAYAPVKVYLGHGPETAFAERKKTEVAAFFGAQADDDFRRSLLRRAQIEYVVTAPETPPGPAGLDAAPYLARQVESGGYAVYRVALDGGP